MLQNLSNHLCVLDARHDRERSAALLAPLDRDPHASTPSAQQVVRIRDAHGGLSSGWLRTFSAKTGVLKNS
jgi:hypothetical protein